MAEKNKSIIESALLDAKRIQEALNANTKEILRSIAIEEIDGLVKESLEEGYVEEDADEDEVSSELEKDEDADEDEVSSELGNDEDDSVEDTDSLEITTDDSEEGDDLSGSYDMSMSDEPLGGDTEVRDMTKASIDNVIRVYRELTGDSEIEVVYDDESGELELSVNEPGKYIIKTDDGASEVEPDGDADDLTADDFAAVDIDDVDDTDVVDEVMYEIALDEMVDIDGIKAPLGDGTGDNTTYAHAEGDMVMSESDESSVQVQEEEVEEEGTLEESIPVSSAQAHRLPGKADIGQPKGAGADNLEESKKPTMTINEVANKYNTLLVEAKDLRGKNEEYKEALKQFRTMLAETVVFNSNLTYVTKLFMEHSTTKDEKQVILKRFDEEVSTLKESKRLYKTIVNELSSRKPINETIDRKLNKDVSSGVSKQLNESTAYIDKETQRIKDLMSRVENR